MFVKICAITSPEDAEVAVAAGADAVGMIFAPSTRRVEIEQAVDIAAAVRGDALVVGVFRDHLAGEIVEVAATVGLDAVQLHGDETVQTSRTVHESVPVLIKGCAVDGSGLASLTELDRHGADAVLLDGPAPGSGQAFDWSIVGDFGRRQRLILAGGLRPANVADAIAAVGPWGVDVASGVEASPGHKDHDAIRAFVGNARAAFADHPSSFPPLDRKIA